MKASLFFLSAVILVSIDFVYLSWIKPYFDTQIYRVQGSPLCINLWGAILCYFFLVFGLYYFILREKKSILDAFLLGLVLYGVYETTSYSLLKNWSFQTVIMDTLWGGILFALTTFFINKILIVTKGYTF
jgi:uncharacterized membrane protein